MYMYLKWYETANLKMLAFYKHFKMFVITLLERARNVKFEKEHSQIMSDCKCCYYSFIFCYFFL